MTDSIPPMEPDTSEADERQLQPAREQGEAYLRGVQHMIDNVAHSGGSREAGHYLIGYAVEEAEGMYEWRDGELEWQDPGESNAHIEIAVLDRADHRFVPDVKVVVTVIDPDGTEVGTHEHPILWHPMIYHFGRNWTLPADGAYTLRVRVEPPTFMRHDEVNGRRFTEVVEVAFEGVDIERGQD